MATVGIIRFTYRLYYIIIIIIDVKDAGSIHIFPENIWSLSGCCGPMVLAFTDTHD